MKTPDLKLCVFRTACVMVLVPMVFLVVYLPVYMMLPEHVAIRADLLQDLTLVLIADIILVPVAGIWVYLRIRRQALGTGKNPVPENTRDMY